MVACVGRVGVNQPKRVKVGPEKRFQGGDIEGEDVIHLSKPGEHGK